MANYIAKCRQCGKRLKDPDDKPIYVVVTDEYFCNQKCLSNNAK
jgi:hypothetical protein